MLLFLFTCVGLTVGLDVGLPKRGCLEGVINQGGVVVFRFGS